MERAALPLVAITSVVARPKSKTKPLLRGKKLDDGAPPVGRGSSFAVIRPGDVPPVGRRWAVIVSTTQNHFRLDTGRPSHGSRNRKGVGALCFLQARYHY